MAFLQALRYQLTMYHPYRPLKALLVECIAGYVQQQGQQHATTGGAAHTHAAAAAAVVEAAALAGLPPAAAAAAAPADAGDDRGHQPQSEPLPPPPLPSHGPLLAVGDERFQRQWDALQARAFECADLALVTDAPLLHSPATLAAACLLLAAEPHPAAGSDSASAAGSDSASASAAVEPSASRAPPDAVTLAALAPALAASAAASADGSCARPPAPDVAWFVEPGRRRRLLLARRAGAEGGEQEQEGGAVGGGGGPPPSSSWERVMDALAAVRGELRELAAATATGGGGGGAYHARVAVLERRLRAHLNPACVQQQQLHAGEAGGWGVDKAAGRAVAHAAFEGR